MTSALLLAIPPTLIGLTGAVGAGKDSVAAVLLRAGWRGMAFADALRIEVAEAWGVDIRRFSERAGKDRPTPETSAGRCMHAAFLRWAAYSGISLIEPRSPRWAMQRWGEFRRGMAADWWVRHVEVWLTNQQRNNHPGLVVTDVRMANEAQMLRSMGGWLVRVHRPGAGLQASDTATHQSEGHTALQVDDDIDNSGTLHDLHLQVDALVQRLRARVAAAHGAELLSTRGAT